MSAQIAIALANVDLPIHSPALSRFFTLAVLITRSVDTWACTALASSHSSGLGTFGPRLLLVTVWVKAFPASASKYGASPSAEMGID